MLHGVEGWRELGHPSYAIDVVRSSWVYILQCSDGSYYTGCTSNLELRIAQHEQGAIGGYTATRLPVTVKWSVEFDDIRYAIEAERKIKGWSHRKKEALIKGDFELLHELAQSEEMKERRKSRTSA